MPRQTALLSPDKHGLCSNNGRHRRPFPVLLGALKLSSVYFADGMGRR